MAANGGSAFIAKKDFNGVSITMREPSSLARLGVLLGLANLFRKSAYFGKTCKTELIQPRRALLKNLLSFASRVSITGSGIQTGQ